MRNFWFGLAFILAACLPSALSTPTAPPVLPSFTPPRPAPTATLVAPTLAPPTAAVGPLTGQYLLALHACDSAAADCRSPQNHRVYLAHSDDGATWRLVPNWQPFVGSVPDVIRRGDTLYIYTASGDVAKYHLATGQLDAPVKTTVAGLDTGYADPSLWLDAQGQLHLVFLNGFVPGGNPARCPTSETTCVKYVDSAVEAPGSEGERFTLDSGHRIVAQLGAGEFDSVSDPDIFFDGQQYVLYLSHGPSITAWTSPTLTGEFVRVTQLTDNTLGVPAGFFDAPTGQYWTFGHARENATTVIRRAVHPTLAALDPASLTTLISGQSVGLGATVNVESPGFAVNTP